MDADLMPFGDDAALLELPKGTDLVVADACDREFQISDLLATAVQ